MAEVHVMSRDSYGAPRIHAELRLGMGVGCSRKRVAKLVGAARLAGISHRLERGWNRPETATRDDLVQRRLIADTPNPEPGTIVHADRRAQH
ncbi:IS3 family transposase [Nakamurella sp. A5-74]|uniref:IS3 family transposase n=1 Tax=Nakamurella sp. A5-74 TaxID=3158264 RepID=A0AAU8DWG0_9ACTN